MSDLLFAEYHFQFVPADPALLVFQDMLENSNTGAVTVANGRWDVCMLFEI